MKRILFTLVACGAILRAQSNVVTLDQATQEAIANNLDLAAEKYNISLAEARQITAKLKPNPVLTVNGNHLDITGIQYNATNNAGPNELSIRTDFLLERGGKRDARIGLAQQEKTLAELGLRDTLRKLIFDVQSGFVDVQLAKEALALAQANLTSLNDIVNINTARVRSGDLAQVELNRSQVAALQFQTAVRQAELQLRQAKTRLQLLLGRTTLADDFDVSGPPRRDTQPIALEDVRTRAQLQRPDLLTLQRTQARNQADLRLQLAQGKIDYTVGTEYTHQQAPGGRADTVGIYFSTPLPIYNRNQGEILRAQRGIDQAAALVKALEAKVNNEVVAAWQQYTVTRELVDDIEKNILTKASDVRTATEYSYRRGEASLVEFLDAQRAFNDVTQSYNEARANFARSLYQIDAVTGASVTDRN